MAEAIKKSDIALTAAFTAAVTSFAVGLPLDFLTEAFTFPFAHESALGQTVMSFSSEYLVPVYDEIGTWFGIEPLGQMVADVPVAEL